MIIRELLFITHKYWSEFLFLLVLVFVPMIFRGLLRLLYVHGGCFSIEFSTYLAIFSLHLYCSKFKISATVVPR